MTGSAFHLVSPARRSTSVVFASPHSGRVYPPSLLDRTVLDRRTLRSSEDAFVDDLFESVPRHGASLITAQVPRAYVDFNRSAAELDPALIEGARTQGHNPRVASGLGVIPRVVSGGRAIYCGKIPMSEAIHRIDTCWAPYHAALKDELDKVAQVFGEAILIDCHSMPHEAIDAMACHGHPRPQVVLGDRFGAAAHERVVAPIETAFRAAGLNVVRNTPFAGAYITQHYGRPAHGRHVVQIEIDRALYMDEKTIRPSAEFGAFKALIEGIIAHIADIGRLMEPPLAAE